MSLFQRSFPYSFNFAICRFVYYSFISRKEEFNVFFEYLTEIEKHEKLEAKSSQIFSVFGKFLIKYNTQESNYLLQKLIEQELIDQEIVQHKDSFYFCYFKTKEQIKRSNTLTYYNQPLFYRQFITNIDELSKNDWELHKQLIKEGVNPSKISKIIRNDEIEKLQEISSQPNFDFNQTIEPSLYERCSFINEENVTLIDYAAFFSSIKCFKYLLMNEATVNKTGKYAIAGGNLEIIHLCEQYHTKFEDVYETAIKFHRNDVFHYFYEKNMIKINDLAVLGIKCVKYNNFEIFSF